jgi:hypothetical protein
MGASCPPGQRALNKPLPKCDTRYYPSVVWVCIGVFIAIIVFLTLALILMWTSVWDTFTGTSKERIGLIIIVAAGIFAVIGIILGIVLAPRRGDVGVEVACETLGERSIPAPYGDTGRPTSASASASSPGTAQASAGPNQPASAAADTPVDQSTAAASVNKGGHNYHDY